MILSKLRALIAFVQFVITVSCVIILMLLFNKQNSIIRKIWSKMQLKLLGVDLFIKGEIDYTADLLLINHQSLLDIIILEALHYRDIAWIAKKEIAKIPFFGHIIKAPKMISIDRENKSGLVNLLREVQERLKHKRPIAIFPEGTRGNGDKLLEFKVGAKLIAEKYKLKVQPVIISGSRTILDSQKFNANPGRVSVIFLKSFYPKSDDWYSDLHKNMQLQLEKQIKNAN